MSIVDGKGLIIWEGGLFEPGSDLLQRTQWAFGRIRADGGHIVLNEAGRPYGVPGDQYVRNDSQTASGRSTVYFQWGRYKRGETPSAANPALGPYASEHTQGKAIDCDAQDANTVALRTKYFAMVGMLRTIPSESWHYAIRGGVQAGVTLANFISKPITEVIKEAEADDMKTIWNKETKTVAVVGAGRYYPLGRPTGTTMDSYHAIAKVFGEYVELTNAEYIEVVHACCGQIDLAKPYIA